MQFFNLGLGEVLFILLIAMLVLGPERIVAYSRLVGKWIRGVINSPIWKEVMSASQEIRQIPENLIESSGIKDDISVLKNEMTGLNTEFQAQLVQIKTETTPTENNETETFSMENEAGKRTCSSE
jgi:hypothetical protein